MPLSRRRLLAISGRTARLPARLYPPKTIIIDHTRHSLSATALYIYRDPCRDLQAMLDGGSSISIVNESKHDGPYYSPHQGWRQGRVIL